MRVGGGSVRAPAATAPLRETTGYDPFERQQVTSPSVARDNRFRALRARKRERGRRGRQVSCDAVARDKRLRALRARERGRLGGRLVRGAGKQRVKALSFPVAEFVFVY